MATKTSRRSTPRIPSRSQRWSNDPGSSPNGQPDKNLVVTAPAVSNPQAGKLAQGGQ